MKALYNMGERQMELREIPTPVPAQDEYLIKIHACGVCGSDYEGYLGHTARRLPGHIMGHECAGVVEMAPKGGVYPVGSRVIPFSNLFCGTCNMCRMGKTNTCESADFLGVLETDGAMAEYLVTKEKYLLPIHDALSFEEAAAVEPLAVAYSAITQIDADALKNAESVLVVGSGTIGLFAALVLAQLHGKNVVVSDMLENRLAKAKQIGAVETINPGKQDFNAEVRRITNNKLFPIVVEAVGTAVTARSSIEALRKNGTVIWVGSTQKEVEINMQHVVTWNLRIQGSCIYTLETFQTCADLVSSGKIDVKPLITNRYSLENAAQAFYDLENNRDGSIIKAMITM